MMRVAPPPDGKDGPLGAERERILGRLRVALRQVIDDIVALRVESWRLADAAAQRPLTPAELQRVRALVREGTRLQSQLRHLRADLGRVPAIN